MIRRVQRVERAGVGGSIPCQPTIRCTEAGWPCSGNLPRSKSGRLVLTFSWVGHMASSMNEGSFDVPFPREPAGTLPDRSPDRIWGGPSAGGDCAVCGASVDPGELELEMEFDGNGDGSSATRYQVHVRCFPAWQVKNVEPDGSLEPI
jgi:hypothetical protein